jgi:Tfp pilus assembly protein PilN
VVGLLLAGLAGYELRQDLVRLNRLERELAALQPRVRRLEKIRDDLARIRHYASSRYQALDALVELYRVTPEGISLSSLNYERSGTLTLQGSARTIDEVLDYADRLSASETFGRADIRFASERQREKGHARVEFELVCHLRSETKDAS